MESYSINCWISKGCLSVSWYVDDSEEWGGSDYIRNVCFSELDTLKLFDTLKVDNTADALAVKDVISERFSNNLYTAGHKLKDYCAANDIHYSWHEYVDHPGIFDRIGEN